MVCIGKYYTKLTKYHRKLQRAPTYFLDKKMVIFWTEKKYRTHFAKFNSIFVNLCKI